MFLSFACFYSFSELNSPLLSVFELSAEKARVFAFRMIVLSRKAIIVLSLNICMQALIPLQNPL